MANQDDALLLDDAPPNLDDALRPRRSRRNWVIRAGLLALAAVVALVVILRPPILPRFAQALNLYVASNVSWGRVEVRGNGLDVSNGVPSTFVLNSGFGTRTYTLTFIAAPFLPQTCVISLPRQASDSCALGNTRSHGPHPPLPIDFDLGLAQLPHDQQILAQQAVDHYLRLDNEPEPVQVGGHYALGVPGVARVYVATAPLIAKLVTRRLANDATCNAICAGSAFSGAPPAGANHLWAISVAAQQEWMIFPSQGNIVHGPSLGGVPESQGDVSLSVYAMQAGDGWIIQPTYPGAPQTNSDSQICLDGEVVFANLYFQKGLEGLQTDYSLVDRQNDGCLIKTHYTTNGVSQPVAFLWRLGELYAANALTASIAPTFPQANSIDLAAFQDTTG